jgi:hypothetical protein
MNRTGSGVSIHLQDEDKRIRTLPEAEGTLRMRVIWRGMLQECSWNVQDEHRDDPSGIVVGRTPPSFRGREIRGPSYFQHTAFYFLVIPVSSIKNAPNECVLCATLTQFRVFALTIMLFFSPRLFSCLKTAVRLTAFFAK